MTRFIKKPACLYITLMLLVSCSNDDIQTYRQSKSISETPPATHSHTEDITWTAPSAWQELPLLPQGMRAGSFSAPEVDISIIFLEGDGGGNLDNVNLWRQQVSLDPWTEKECSLNQKDVSTPLGTAKIVYLASEKPLIDDTHHKCIVAASVPYLHGTWFFKMTGEKDQVLAQKENFEQFLTTIRAKYSAKE